MDMNKTYTIRKDGDCERPAVMWGCGAPLTNEDIVTDIKGFKEIGTVNEFYIHSGWMSEKFEYMTDEFFDMIELACDTADKEGMRYSIYDEHAWPSGTCAGKVMKENPDCRLTVLKWYTASPKVGEPTEIWYRGKVLAVQIQYTDKQGKREDITDKVTIEKFDGVEGGRVLWANDTFCTTRVFVFCSYVLDVPDGFGACSQWTKFHKEMIPGGVDVMNPKSFEKYIEYNNSNYVKKIGDRMGKSVKRIFTDETSYCCFYFDNCTRPYSIVLEDEFYKEHGYKIRDNFISMIGDSAADWDVKVRHDYFKTCTRLFTQNWLQSYSDWCHKHNLDLTGHMSGEGILYYHTIQMGDFWEALSKFDVPGVDNILSRPGMGSPMFGGESKMVASVAKFNGKPRTMCETFSGSGHNLTIEDSKRIINKLMMAGITYIIYMTAFASMNEGAVNFPLGYPPSHNYQNVLFKHYNQLTDYVAARSSLLSQTTPIGSALVMIPQVDAWTAPLTDWRNGSRQNNIWLGATNALQKRSVDHDIFFESLAHEAEVKDGKIHLRGFEYDTIVLPLARVSNQAALDAVENLIKQGGRVAFIDKIPYLAADTQKHYDFASLAGLSEEGKKFFAENTKDYKTYEENNIILINIGENEEKVRFKYWDDLSTFVKAGEKADIIDADNMPEGVYMTRRTADGMYCAMIYNDTDVAQSIKVRVDSTDKLTLLDGVKLYDVQAENGYITVEIQSHDMNALILTADGVTLNGLEKGEFAPVISGAEEKIVLDKGWKATADRNMLPLRIKYLAKAEICGKLDPEIAKMAETATVPYAVQEFPAGEGLGFGDSYAAFARFEVNDIPESLELFTEIVDDAEIWLNGNLLSDYKKVHERGPKDKVTDITKYVKLGTNILIMLHRIPEWKAPHKMPANVIRGNFSLDKNDAIIAKCDDIDVNKYYTEQTWRYFSGDITYSNTFELADDNFKKVTVSTETKEVAEIIVNGTSAKVCAWAPYEADVTHLCKKGINSVDIVFTTTNEPMMVLEEVKYIVQGVSEIHEDVKPQEVGTNTPPVITIIK